MLLKKASNIGKPYNSKYSEESPFVDVQPKDNMLYLSSNRENGFGLYDIYKAKEPYYSKPNFWVSIQGRVHDIDSSKGIEANITIIEPNGKKRDISSQQDGNYQITLKNKNIYTLIVSAPGYSTSTVTVNLKKVFETKSIQKDIALNTIFYIPRLFKIYYRFIDSNRVRIEPTVELDSSGITSAKKITVNQENEAGKKWDTFYIYIPDDVNTKQKFINYLYSNSFTLNATLLGFQSFQKSYPLSQMFQEPFQKNKFYIENTIINTTQDGYVSLGEKKQIGILFFPLGDYINYVSKKELDNIIEHLRKKNYNAIEIHGHTDAIGEKNFNVRLSINRAETIQKLIIENGIPSNKITILGFGEERPLVPNQRIREPKNRRVEVWVIDNTKNNRSAE